MRSCSLARPNRVRTSASIASRMTRGMPSKSVVTITMVRPPASSIASALACIGSATVSAGFVRPP